jgi:hypothetical protein
MTWIAAVKDSAMRKGTTLQWMGAAVGVAVAIAFRGPSDHYRLSEGGGPLAAALLHRR